MCRVSSLLEGPEGGQIGPGHVHLVAVADEGTQDLETELVTDLSALFGDVHLQVEGAGDAARHGAVHIHDIRTILEHHGVLVPVALEADRDVGRQLGEEADHRHLVDVTLVVLGLCPAEAEVAHDLLGLAQAVVAAEVGLEEEDGATLVGQHVAEQAAGGIGLVVPVVFQVEPVGHALQVVQITVVAGGEPGELLLVGLDDDVQDLAGLQTVVAVGLVRVLDAVGCGREGAEELLAADQLAVVGATGGAVGAARGLVVGVHSGGGHVVGGRVGIGVHAGGRRGVTFCVVLGRAEGGASVLINALLVGRVAVRSVAGGAGLVRGTRAIAGVAAGQEDGQEGEGTKGESGHTVSSVWHNGGRSSRGDPKISSSLSWSSRMEDMS